MPFSRSDGSSNAKPMRIADTPSEVEARTRMDVDMAEPVEGGVVDAHAWRNPRAEWWCAHSVDVCPG